MVSSGDAKRARLSDQIQKELAELLRLRAKDPRIGLVTITAVDLSPDRRHARVFFSTLEPAENIPDIARALNHASGFLRTGLARQLRRRSVPDLHFVHDISITRGMELSTLIDSAMATTKAGRSDPGE